MKLSGWPRVAIAVAVAAAAAACGDARPVVGGKPLCRDADGGLLLVHPCGWADPSSVDFHGTFIANSGWSMATCQGCHGDDFKGGASGVSCWTCHSDGGPTGCTTCHGQPPATGAHLAHSGRYDCTSCHTKPLVYTDPGHLDGNGAVVLAQGSFDTVAKRCSGVYCHGGTFTDSKASNTTPLWTGGASQAACGTCHGLPPSSHARSSCVECHSKVIDASGNIIDPSRHVDGKISLGDESGTCSACHSIDPAKLSGAHLGHMTASLELRGPLACSDCHRVPVQVTDPGHIDEPGPPQIFFGALATANGSQPMWKGASCSGSWCHGSAQPAWTDGPSAAYCGTCHAIPPASHTPGLLLTDCVKCHPTTMDASGAFVPSQAGGTHLNGVVDVQ